MAVERLPHGRTWSQNRSMTDDVADKLRRMIMSRDLEPGQRITQAELAASLGVSTLPVREALLRLVAEGLVESTTNRSFSVARTTERGVRDIYWMHAHLAGELTVRAWDRRTDWLLEAMAGHHREYLDAMAVGGHERLLDANWAFHTALHRAVDSSTILSIFKNTLRIFPGFSFEIPGGAVLARDWQAGLLREFRGGTREGAQAVAVASIAATADLFVAWFWGVRDDRPAAGAEPAPQISGPRSDSV